MLSERLAAWAKRWEPDPIGNRHEPSRDRHHRERCVASRPRHRHRQHLGRDRHPDRRAGGARCVWGTGKAFADLRAASLALVLEGVLVIAVLAATLMGTQLPLLLIFGGVAPGDLLITVL